MTDGVTGPDPTEGSGIEPDDDPTRSPRRRLVVIGVALVGLAVTGAITAVLVWPSDGGGYSDEVAANFMQSCTADGGDDVEPVCECLYDEIVDTISYDRFEEVNNALETEQAADADADVRLPADFDDIRRSCVEDEGPVSSDPTDGNKDGSTTTAPAGGDTATTAAPESPVITSDAPSAAVPGGVRPTLPPRPPPPPPGPSGAPAPPAPPGGDDPLPATTETTAPAPVP